MKTAKLGLNVFTSPIPSNISNDYIYKKTTKIRRIEQYKLAIAKFTANGPNFGS